MPRKKETIDATTPGSAVGDFTACTVRDSFTALTEDAGEIVAPFALAGTSAVDALRHGFAAAAGGGDVMTLANDGNGGSGFAGAPALNGGATTETTGAVSAAGTFHLSASRGGTTSSCRALVAAT